MLKLNSLLKLSLILFASLLIPSFLSLFKISFDEYIAAQKGQGKVQGASVVNVRTVNGRTPDGEEQSVIVNVNLPRIGSIRNLSERPFAFPNAKANSESPLVNLQAPLSYPDGPNNPVYIISKDGGRGGDSFLFGYGGLKGNYLSFYNGNNYDMNDVRIQIKWSNGNVDYTSIYSTQQIQKKLSYYVAVNKSSEASIPYNPEMRIKGFIVRFKDNAGVEYIAEF